MLSKLRRGGRGGTVEFCARLSYGQHGYASAINAQGIAGAGLKNSRSQKVANLLKTFCESTRPCQLTVPHFPVGDLPMFCPGLQSNRYQVHSQGGVALKLLLAAILAHLAAAGAAGHSSDGGRRCQSDGR